MKLRNIFKKKATNFLSYESFSEQEDFRRVLNFQQKARRDNIKNCRAIAE